MCERAFVGQVLDTLRRDVQSEMSPYRFSHTAGVEKMAARLAALYCPEREGELRAAALLHDITKEYDNERQLAVMEKHGVVLRPDELESPKVWHGMTAALEIPHRYPTLATPELISAVRWHTTGRAGMTLTDAILYLADYIEEGRAFPDCVALRDMFFDAAPEKMEHAARLAHLGAVICRSLEMTVEELERSGSPICLDTEAALRFFRENKYPFEGKDQS